MSLIGRVASLRAKVDNDGHWLALSYAALGKKLDIKSAVTYWVGNPNSYIWLSTERPLSIAQCPTYDYYRDGYTNFTEYPS